jgi:hypothetical protein
LKQNEEWKKVKVAELNQENISESVATKISHNLSVAIETSFFLINGEVVVRIILNSRITITRRKCPLYIQI